jgi:hypothetical protein
MQKLNFSVRAEGANILPASLARDCRFMQKRKIALCAFSFLLGNLDERALFSAQCFSVKRALYPSATPQSGGGASLRATRISATTCSANRSRDPSARG